MQPDDIIIRGAKEHNLKNIDVRLPRNKLIVITGVSGSGKSSLAFDTLYAEGQRRYVESLSAYARQFIGQMEKPKVDFIGGLSPAIAIEQKAVSKNPRSTVATVTEIYDYLRVLFANIGAAHCPQCGREVRAQSAQEIVAQVAALPVGTRFQVLSPVARNRKGTFADVFSQAKTEGFARVRVDGEIRSLEDKISLDKQKKHTVELVVDRLVIPDRLSLVADESAKNDKISGDEFITRLTDSIETALRMSDGLVGIFMDSPLPSDGKGAEGEGELLLSDKNACPNCNVSFPQLSPAMFSFNSPMGMCPDCNGLGSQMQIDVNLIIVNPEISLLDGASRWHGNVRKKPVWHTRHLQAMADHYGVDLELPWKDLPQKFRDVILYGSGDEKIHFEFENKDGSFKGESNHSEQGAVRHISRLFRQTSSEYTKRWYMSFMSQQPCPTCKGQRLRPESAAVTVGGQTMTSVTNLTIGDTLKWVESLWPQLNPEQFQIAEEVLKEINERLQFLVNVGLHYLSLDRPAPTLSGGEGQRIRLASQIGCGLVGVLYVLDEPSIGLHSRDNRRLLDTLERLRDMGNTVVVVEHDEETMHTADWLLDLGPGAGINGGHVVAAGTPAQVMAIPDSLTGQYLRGDKTVSSPNGQRRPTNGKWLTLAGARQNNLKNLTVRFPLGLFTCVTGVSGSGKSSLVAQTLRPALSHILHRAEDKAGAHDSITGIEHVDKIINITQDPIGRTPRSNPATYVDVMPAIRELFAMTPEAKTRGYKAGRFSFNVKGGRCEACRGHGKKVVEMHFLPDVWVTCSVCKGRRFNDETLQVRYKGKNVADVLDMDVEEALEFFGSVPEVKRILTTLADVGLGYVKLGQSATTLSGGEAQRVKLAKELARVATGDTIYILDEPTTGLHFADIQKLLDVLHRLTDAGNTVLVIEHNLDVIKTADWILDLGPEGGEKGGYIVAEGTPEQVAQAEGSFTGQFLREVL
jgi:excinuclease ABC subunit A